MKICWHVVSFPQKVIGLNGLESVQKTEAMSIVIEQKAR